MSKFKRGIEFGNSKHNAPQGIARHKRLAHAAFLLETPQDETGDDARNLDVLRSFVQDGARDRGPQVET